MTPEDVFLQDVRESPDDDVPRLIFADWLEDNGDLDRADFIRARIAHARHRYPESPAAADLERQAQALLEMHWARWVEPLSPYLLEGQYVWPDHRRRSAARTEFRRGFVEAVHTTAPVFLKGAAELFRSHPIRHVTLKRADEHAAALAECQQLEWVEGLWFADYYASLGAPGTWRMARSPHLTRLRLLFLSRNDVGDEGVTALASAAWLGTLREVFLNDNGISAIGATALARADRDFRPERLDLSANRIGDEGVVALANSPVLSSVKSLILYSCGIGARGAEALATSPHLTALEELDVTGNPLDADAVALLDASWPGRVYKSVYEAE